MKIVSFGILKPKNLFTFLCWLIIFTSNAQISWAAFSTSDEPTNTKLEFGIRSLSDLTISSFNPENNSTDVNFDLDVLEITFSEPVTKGPSGTGIRIKNYDTDDNVRIIATSNDNITIDGDQVSIQLEDPLPDGNPYYIEVTPNAFISESGQPFGGIEDKNTWRFDIAPIPELTVEALTPANNSTDVAFDLDVLEITFSEPVRKGPSGTGIRIKNYDTDNNVRIIATSNDNITIDGEKVSIQLEAPLPDGNPYYVEVTPNAFISERGKLFGGIEDKNTWRFDIAPIPELTVEALTPANNSTDVAFNLDVLEITFSEPVRKGPSGTGILIKNYDTDNNVRVIPTSNDNITIDGEQVSIQLDDLLPADNQYYVEVTPNAFISERGKPFWGIEDKNTWRFDIAPIPELTVETLTPANNSTDVTTALSAIEITFSENVKKGTSGVMTIRKLADNTTVEIAQISSNQVNVEGNKVAFTLDTDLLGNTEYYVEVTEGAFESTDGIQFDGISDNSFWRFTTGDASYPTITALSPSNNSSDVSTNLEAIEITFSAPIVKGNKISGGVGIYQLTDGRLVGFISHLSDAISTDQNKATISLEGIELSSETSYYVNVFTGTFLYLSEFRGFPVIDDNQSWRFSTGQLPDFGVVSLLPANNSSDVALTLNAFEITFTEAVKKGDAGNIRLKRYDDDTLLGDLPVTSDKVSLSGAKVSILLSGELPEESELYIEVDPGAFTSLAEEAFNGITDKNTWRFSTETLSDLSITALNPANDTQNVSVNLESLEITFSETVKKEASSTGSIRIYRLSDGQEIKLLKASDEAIKVDQNKASIDLSNVILAPATTYYVIVDPGIFVSDDDRVFPTIISRDVWRFTTTAIVTGIEDVMQQGFQVFPVPSHSEVFVKAKIYIGKNAKYSIINQVGKVVTKGSFTNDNQTQSIDLSGLPNGTYILKVSTGSRLFVQKILKN